MSIPARKGKHALGFLQRLWQAVFRYVFDQDFGIRMSPPPRLVKGTTQIVRVVELAVVGDRPATVTRWHGLLTSFRQVNDGEPSVPEANFSTFGQPNI